MHWLDTVIIAALGLGAVLGFVSGLFWQLARIASLALAVAAAVLWHDQAIQGLRSWALRDTESSIVEVTAYVGVFLLTYLALFLVTRLLRTWLRATDLAMPDRFFGSFLGTAKAAALLGAGCLLLRHTSHPAAQEWLEHSHLAPVFASASEQVVAHLPEDYTKTALDTFRQLQETMARSQGKAKQE